MTTNEYESIYSALDDAMQEDNNIRRQDLQRFVKSANENTPGIIERVFGVEVLDWDGFKEDGLVVLEEQFGVACGVRPGRHGSVIITQVTVPRALSDDVVRYIRDNNQVSDLMEAVGNLVPSLYNLLHGERRLSVAYNGSYKMLRADIPGAQDRVGWREKTIAFSRGSGTGFELIETPIYYDGRELSLEKKIVDSGQIEDILMTLYHSAETFVMANAGSIENPALQNPDIYALTKVKFPDRDEIVLSSFEVKLSHDDSAIYRALSQAVSYRKFANEVWIVAPGLSSADHSDYKKFLEVTNICDEYGFGILNVILSEDRTSVERLVVEKMPRRVEIMNPKILENIVKKLQLKHCHKCSRYVADDEISTGCGWSVKGECMRKLEEKNVTGNSDEM